MTKRQLKNLIKMYEEESKACDFYRDCRNQKIYWYHLGRWGLLDDILNDYRKKKKGA